MKKITLWLIVLCTSVQLQAQLTNGNYTAEVDERIKNLNRISITSNILIDRVFPVARVQNFNQGLRKDTSSVSHFKQAWSELYRTSYNKIFSSVETFKNQLKAKNYAFNVVPIGIINTEFHQCNFGTNAQNANVGFNSSTGLFTNVSGKNPFIKKQTTIIAPLVAKASGNSIAFTTDNLFKLYKQGKRIKTLTLYTNNTSFSLISNYNLSTTNFSTTYQNTGLQTLRFVITFSDNTTKTTYGTVKIIKSITYAQRNSSSNLLTIDADDDLVFQGYDENQAYKGQNEYRIYYDTQNNNRIVNKPLYIIDGYDPNDSRKIDVQDYSNFNSDEDKSLYQLMLYNNGNADIELVKELQGKGYDVIIVNQPVYNRGNKTIDGGSDYIERNAFTFISLLRQIKSIQQSNEEAVIIGPSMGGLISRYALAYMEKKLAETGDHEKWNHNTRLWVSFDSPHQGANIPIGVQKGIQYFAEELEVEGAKTFINEELNKPAPKQMLVNHYTNNTSLPVGASNFRNRFKNALDNLGMPQNLRKVALLNGNMLGDLNGVSSAKYLEIEDDLKHWGPLGGIISVFADKFLAKFYHTTNQKSGSSETFTFDAGIRGKFLWWSWWTTRTNYKSRAKSIGSYDISPGGYYNAQQLLVNETSNPGTDFTWYLLNWTFHDLNSTLIDPTHSFIPTKSALAYTGSNVLDENISNKNRVCTGETPFDSYFAPKENEEHIHLTSKNVAWLLEEVEDNPQLPVPSVANTSLYVNGNKKLCLNKLNTVTFSVPKCSTPKIISWSTTPNLQVVSTTPYTAEIKVLRNRSTPSFVYATLAGGDRLTKQVFLLDKPTITFPNTSLRDAILAGGSSTSYPNVTIKSGERADFESTLATRISWKYTRERVYIPPAEPGTEVIYDPESLQGNFVPYLSCFREDIDGNTNAPNSVKDKVSLIDYHFTEDNYRNLPETPDRPPLPDGMEYPVGPEQELAETPPNKSPKITFNKTGYIEVEVTASNECGCLTETNVYKTSHSSTGGSTPIPTLPKIDFTLSPNPAQDFFSVNLFRNSVERNQIFFLNVDISLSVVSVTTGRTVYSKSFIFSDKTESLLLSAWGFPTGIYVVKINSIYGVVSKNIIIE